MKNYSMRAVLAMLLCLALVFSFAGCQNSQGGTAPEKETVDQKPQQTEPATSPAETGAKEPDPMEDSHIDVTQPENTENTSAETIIQVTDAYADAVTYADQTLCYHIPEIVSEDGRYEIVNARFYERFHQILLQEVYYHIQHGASPGLSAMTYTWGIKGDVISVLIETSAYEYPGKDYYVYHISAKTGEPVEYTELFLAFDTGEKDFLALTKSAVEAYWNRRVSEMDPEVVSSGALQPYIDNSLAEDNLKAAIPYINAEGELCFVVKIFSPAGADYYWTLLNTADGAVEELPDCSMEHTAD